MEIAKIEQPKNLTVPAKALSEAKLNEQIAYLGVWLEGILSIKHDGTNEKRLLVLLPIIKESAWSLSISQIQEAFKLYIDGKLSYNNEHLEPVSNYLDTILFKKVISAYKQVSKKKYDPRESALKLYEKWRAGEKLSEQKGIEYTQDPLIPEVFDYLYGKVLPKKDENEAIRKAYARRMTAAQGHLYAPYIDKCKWMEKEDLADTPKFNELQEAMAKIRSLEDPRVNKKFKELVLIGYFEKLKGKHLNHIL